MFFILFLFSSFCENVAVSFGNNQVIFSEEKASWQAAVSYCRSYGKDWVLPSLDNQYDINAINEGMKKRNWKSVWTGIKREIFDAYYWEDGSYGANLDDSDNIEKHSFQPCVTLAIKNQKYEKVDCYALGVLGVCLVDTCNCSGTMAIMNCIPHGTSCYVWPDKAMSWFSSRNWCFRTGGHLMNKSDIDQYKHPDNSTSLRFLWTGLRRGDWVFHNKKTGNKYQSLTVNLWEDNEPLEGNKCAVLFKNLWKTKPCRSVEHIICIGPANNSLKSSRYQISTSLVSELSTETVDLKTDQPTDIPGFVLSDSGSGSGSSRNIFLPITLVLSLIIVIVTILTIMWLSCRRVLCKGTPEYAEVQTDQMQISTRQSPSNRPPVPIPQSDTINAEDQLYSTPLTEEDILRMVMTSVRKQLGETSKMPAMKRRSCIRSAAKGVIEDYLEPVIDESGSGQMVLKKGKTLNTDKDIKLTPASVSYKVPVPIQYESGPSSQDSQPSTKAELNEARDILSEILNDIFTTRKGNIAIGLSLGEGSD